jgi:hypothetical protein
VSTALRRLRRLPGHFRPRRMRLFGVGMGKTGSTTLARMFGRYRSAHEVDAKRMLPIATAVLKGEVDVEGRRVRFEARRRGWRFHLDVDSAPFLNPLTPALVAAFDDAKFVLLLRDCFSWLDSHVEWERSHPPSDLPMFAPYRAALFHHPGEAFTAQDRLLEQHEGLQPVRSYLRSWAERNEEVIRVVPPERLLVVRTEDLDQSTATLARFAGVPEDSVTTAHANENPNRTGLLSRVNRNFVVECAEDQCAELMETYWGPRWRELATGLPH